MNKNWIDEQRQELRNSLLKAHQLKPEGKDKPALRKKIDSMVEDELYQYGREIKIMAAQE